jgi:hypothetical protein
MTPQASLSRLAVLGAAVLMAVMAGAATASAAVADPVPITPNTFFSGLVNGTSPADITVVCSSAAATGHPADGQYVEALLASSTAASTGYTGTLGTSLTVKITTSAPSTTTSSLIGVLKNFYEELAIPTTLTLPCTGTGVVTFAPTPTSVTAKTASVTVKLVSSSVTPGAFTRR